MSIIDSANEIKIGSVVRKDFPDFYLEGVVYDIDYFNLSVIWFDGSISEEGILSCDCKFLANNIDEYIQAIL